MKMIELAARYRVIIQTLLSMLLDHGENYESIGKRLGISRQAVRKMNLAKTFKEE